MRLWLRQASALPDGEVGAASWIVTRGVGSSFELPCGDKTPASLEREI